jgi:hypothetical protein
MAYPLSNDVSAGQPTAFQHYNNLRRDALYLGQEPADAVPLGVFLGRYARNIRLEYLAVNRLRVPYATTKPPALMVGGRMLTAAANVDLPAGSFSGAAALWYVFARAAAGSTTFTLEVNTSPSETAGTRLIGEVYWDGSNLVQDSIRSYEAETLPPPDYDSGWFAVAYNNTYIKAHSLGTTPRLVILWHATSPAPGASELVRVNVVYNGTSSVDVLGADASNLYFQTANSSAYGVVHSTRRASGSGYYRAFAWR